MDFYKAFKIAWEAHKGQVDKAGQPYILHPIRVAMQGENEVERIVGLLHDVVEDSEWSIDDLIDAGASPVVAEAINYLSHKEGESYDCYIDKIKYNPLARKVKIFDLMDNSDLSRIPDPSEKDLKRTIKYLKAMITLKENS